MGSGRGAQELVYVEAVASNQHYYGDRVLRLDEPVVHIHYGNLQFNGNRSQMRVVHIEVADRPAYEEGWTSGSRQLTRQCVRIAHLRRAARQERAECPRRYRGV